MSHVDIEELAALALEHDDAPETVRRHVADCAECAALVAALAEVRGLAGATDLIAPPPGVRGRVLAHLRSDDDGNDRGARREDDGDGDGPSAPVTPLPKEPVPGPPPAARRPDRRAGRVPVWAAGLAAAVALVAGLGLGRLSVADPEPREELATVVAAADLTALDSDDLRGEARAVRSEDTLTLRVEARALGDEDGFREVWLINVDGTRMVALGVLASGDEGEFQVPRGLIDDGYRIVDISVEPEDGDPRHSGVSLARGELT
ncbi:anti-sigma factor [Nocardioides xinjiangensis]|uniref:anti-sigma factor n=1 Tax=Nocardioides xinjiangensis TaxID=2817376 RepID=UPI001B31633A|nr:anti-sigma factor [Nocardioides sp. SYSU D00778]